MHSYSLVGHLCSPNPVIIEDAIHAMSTHGADYEEAVEDLVKKLLLDPNLVGDKKRERLAYLIEEFWTDLNHFQNRTGPYNRDHIWISAAREETRAYRWHQRHSLGGRTKSFGSLACLVTSKPGGGGTCERNWKQYKQAKTGKRNKIGGEKTKKQVTIYGRYQQIKGQLRSKSLATAHKLWEEEDFDTMKMDAFYSEIVASLKPVENAEPRIFRAWEETWEKATVPPDGNTILEERFLRKYGGLKWVDDKDFMRYTARSDVMGFQKKRGNNRYFIFGIQDGYDMSMDADDQPQLYEKWERTEDFYEMITKYYENDRSVKCYQKGGDCESEEE